MARDPAWQKAESALALLRFTVVIDVLAGLVGEAVGGVAALGGLLALLLSDQPYAVWFVPAGLALMVGGRVLGRAEPALREGLRSDLGRAIRGLRLALLGCGAAALPGLVLLALQFSIWLNDPTAVVAEQWARAAALLAGPAVVAALNGLVLVLYAGSIRELARLQAERAEDRERGGR